MTRYLGQIEDLAKVFRVTATVEDGREAHQRFRELVDHVTVRPTEPRAPLNIEIAGRLGVLMNDQELPPSGRYSGVEVVPQEGFEPPTPALRMLCSTN